ncbi:hypothetical protein RUND412_005404 [Rhizina undulata]
MSEQTPRVNAPLLDSFKGRNIRIVGKVTQIMGENAKIDAQGTIDVILDRNSRLTVGNGAEIVGKVLPDLRVKVLTSQDIGKEVDYNIADALVEVTHRYKEIFYDS